MPVIYTEADAEFTALSGQPLSVIGYEARGRTVAHNLRDSGLSVLIGDNHPARQTQAAEDGFAPLPYAEAAREGVIKLLTLSDEHLSGVYHEHLSPSLKNGDALVFFAGYNIAFGFIEPPPFVDAVMIAPRAADLREQFMGGRAALSYVAVAQDATGSAWPRLLAVARAVGALRAGALELSFEQEAEIDLFIQQTLLPALHQLMLTAADVLIKEGYPPEAALLDLYISGELGDLLQRAARQGLQDLLAHYSSIAQYGMLSRLDRYQDARLRRQIEVTLEEIRAGRFAQEWTNEHQNGYPRLASMQRKRQALPLWALEKRAIDLLNRAAGNKS